MSELYDLIVVGAGTAGLPCAYEAATHGARVLVLEKSDEIGGTLHISGGHMSAAGTRRQRERGIGDSVAAHIADVMRISRGTARPDLVRLAAALAPATVDWLDAHGFSFAPETPRIVYGHEPYSVARTYYGVDEARSILAVLRRLVEPLLRSDAIDLRLETALTGFVCEDGRVAGVHFEGPAGSGIARAPATVLATGGYGAAPDLFAELDGWPLVTAARKTSTGDGLRLARELGAAIVGRGMFIPTFGGLPAPEAPGRVVWHERPRLVAAERPPWEIYVTRAGRRFVAEDTSSIDEKERALCGVPDLTFFVVFDERALEASSPVVVGWTADDLRARANRRPGVFAAPSLRELAHRAGIDPAVLEETVAEYNAAVATGRDARFGRVHLPAPIEHPPFYALQNHGITLITFAGIAVDSDLRVRRADGSVIPGLYAAGEVIGAAATMGNSFCGGMAITPALSFGRLLGQRLAPAVRAGSAR
jgi:succinate dehydrogenase/fumarate reductase flavoprotein subunit